MKKNIVLLEDELLTGQALQNLLQNKGFNCIHYTNVEALIKHPHAQTDIYILDYHIEGKPEGFCAAQELRSMGVRCPIIMLTSESGEKIIVECFKAAQVDDYLNKPVRIEELTVRIETHLSKSPTKKRIFHNELTVDIESDSIFIGHKPVDVTHAECRIIQCLLENKGKILRRNELIDFINEEKVTVGKRTIDTQINTIRNKICPTVLKITSKRGIGYGVMG